MLPADLVKAVRYLPHLLAHSISVYRPQVNELQSILLLDVEWEPHQKFGMSVVFFQPIGEVIQTVRQKLQADFIPASIEVSCSFRDTAVWAHA
jgi:hypothetical protein